MIIAREQAGVMPLPISVDGDGLVMTEWQPTTEELFKLLAGERVRLWIYGTQIQLGRPFTPLRMEVTESATGVPTC
jgi:hypothetical protein